MTRIAMSAPRIVKPALLAHTFFALADVLPGGAAVAELAALWASIRGLGLTEPIGAMPCELATPSVGARVDQLVVLGACRSAESGVVEAVAYQTYDAVVVSVMLAPVGSDVRWVELDRRWASASASMHA